MDEYREKVTLAEINELRNRMRDPVKENIAKEQHYAESIIEDAVTSRPITPLRVTPKVPFPGRRQRTQS